MCTVIYKPREIQFQVQVSYSFNTRACVGDNRHKHIAVNTFINTYYLQ